MLTRRHLFTGGLAVAASAFAGERLVVAKRRPPRQQKAQYLSYSQLGPGVGGVFNLFVYARGLDIKRLRRARQPVRVSIPYPKDSYVVESLDHNPRKRFNTNGYTVRTGPFAAYVPVHRKPDYRIVVHVHLYELQPDGTQHSFIGRGEPHRWIPLRRKR